MGKWVDICEVCGKERWLALKMFRSSPQDEVAVCKSCFKKHEEEFI